MTTTALPTTFESAIDIGRYGTINTSSHLLNSFFLAGQSLVEGFLPDFFVKFTVDVDNASIAAQATESPAFSNYLILYDAQRNVIANTASNTINGSNLNTFDLLGRGLPKGVYYIQIHLDESQSGSQYNFGLTVGPAPLDDNAGESEATALDLGHLSAQNKSIAMPSGALQTVFQRTMPNTSDPAQSGKLDINTNAFYVEDTVDYYKFHLDSAGTVAVNPTGTFGQMVLFGDAQGPLASDFATLITSGKNVTLNAGDYYLAIYDKSTTVTPQGAGVITFHLPWETVEKYAFNLKFTPGGLGGADPSLPDLVVSSISVPDTTLFQGQGIQFDYTLRNNGATDAGAGNISFYISKDNIITTADTRIGFANSFNAVKAGGSQSHTSVGFNIPSTLAPGQYYVGVIADADKQVAETNDNNNSSQGVLITVRSAAPDLAITGATVDNNEIEAGDLVEGSFTLWNFGPIPVNPGNVGLYLSKDATITAADTLISILAFPEISVPGEGGIVVSGSRYLPSIMTPGDWYIGAIADYDNKVAESKETNNASAGVLITVTAPPPPDPPVRWLTGVSGDFSTEARWSTGAVPTGADNASLSAAGVYTVSTQNEIVNSLTTAKGATLSIEGGGFGINAGTGAGIGSNAGTIRVTEGNILNIGDGVRGVVFNNTGIVALNAAIIGSELSFQSDTILTGAGKITLSNNAGNLVGTSNASTLFNVNNTISGAGLIGGGTMSVFNQAAGIFTANASNALVIDTDGDFINAGTLQATGSGGLLIDIGTTIKNTKTGVVSATGAMAHVDLKYATIAGGTLKTATGATIKVIESATLDGSTAPLTNAATVLVNDSSFLTLVGTINNTGLIALNTVGDTFPGIGIGNGNSTDVVLTGAGKIKLTETELNGSSIGGGSGVETLRNVDNTIFGAGTITTSTIGLINGAKGVINATGLVHSLTMDGGPIYNDGLIESTTAGGLVLAGGTTLVNSPTGVLAALGAKSHIDIDDATIAGGTLKTDKFGVIGFASAGTTATLDGSTSSGKVTNAGTLNLGADSSLILRGAIANTGSINLASSLGSKISLATSSLTGTGKIVLGDNDLNRIDVETDALIRNDTTIVGAGTIDFGAAHFFNNAKGVIRATGTSNALYLTAPDIDHVFSNAGLIESAGAAGIVLFGDFFNASTGVVAAAKGSQIDLGSSTITGGKVTTAATSTVFSTGQNVIASTVLNAGTIESRFGNLVINGPVTNTGKLLSTAGQLTVHGTVIGGIAAIEGPGSVELDGASNVKVVFGGDAVGTLILDTSGKFTGSVAGFNDDDVVVLTDVDYIGQSATFTTSATAAVLTVSDGLHSARITFSGNYLNSVFTISDDGQGDVAISGDGVSRTGTANNDTIISGAFADTLDGGDNLVGGDTISYATSPTGITVSLEFQDGSSSQGGPGYALGDVLTNFENLVGTPFGDYLVGDANNNKIDGTAGNDFVDGGLGDDTLIGGLGIDTVTYERATGSIGVDLNIKTAQTTGAAGTDSVAGFENLIGSDYADVLKGDALPNAIFGLGGNDMLSGGAGNDLLDGAAGNDAIDGGIGVDTVIYSGAKSGYTIVANPNGSITVTDIDLGDGSNDGIDNLINVERLKFMSSPDGLGETVVVTSAPLPVSISVADTAAIEFGTRNLPLEEGGGGVFDMTFKVSLSYASATPITVRYATVPANQNGPDIHSITGTLEFAPGETSKDVVVLCFDDADAETNKTITLNLSSPTGGAKIADGTAQGTIIDNDGPAIVGSPIADILVGDRNPSFPDDPVNFDLLYGMGGNDKLIGGIGDDLLDGGEGADALDGGVGSDGADYGHSAIGLTVNLSDPSQNTGIAKGDTYTAIENLGGSNFADVLVGDDADNGFIGQGGDDVIDGGIGSDQLSGSMGNDTLTGGPGIDFFAFGSPGQGKDTITDFVSGTDWIAAGPFGFQITEDGGGNLPLGGKTLSTAPGHNYFVSGTAATESNHGQFIFDSTTDANHHILYWDADGTGAGAKVAIADLLTSILSSNDIMLLG